jgi:hypothetical protein
MTSMSHSRPFKLTDAMILTAAAAVWMAMMRPRGIEFQMVSIPLRNAPTWRSYVPMARDGLGLLIAMLTWAYLGMRLIPPKPLRSDLIRQPGMLFICIVFTSLILMQILSAFIPLVPEGPWMNLLIACAVGLPWLVAARYYRSRAEFGWIEGVGRSVAVGWIVITALSYPLYLLAE